MASPLPTALPEAIPVGFDGLGGWLHPAGGRTGILMIGATGYEGTNAYRAWRDLGLRFARAGLPALRLTLPGLGDSPEPDGLPDLVPRWLAAIGTALAWMRTELELDEVVPCGLHLGALLAAQGAARAGGTERIIMLAPPASGAQYMRAQRARARLMDFPLEAALPGRVELPALQLHQQAARDLEALGFGGIAAARRGLILAKREADACPAVACLGDDGAAQRHGFDTEDTLLFLYNQHRWPEPSWAPLASWLAPEARPERPVLPPAARPVRHAGWIERHVAIPVAGGTALAGVHTGPTGAGAGPAVLLFGTGANPNSGYGRAGAHLARRLAEEGTCSLRADISGIGDSGGEREIGLDRLYDAAQTRETGRLLDWMREQGHGRFVLVGICSGAYQALAAARTEPGVVGIVLANQLIHGRWQGGGVTGWRRRRYTRATEARQRQAAPRPPRHVGATAPSRMRLFGAGVRAAVAAEAWFAKIGCRLGLGAAERGLRAATRRGQRVLVVLSREDEAMQVMEAQLGPGLRSLGRIQGLETIILPRADHALGLGTAQMALRDAVSHFVAGLRERR